MCEALVVRAGLRVGESILVHGGAGGVGHVAIQLAKAIGARVFTTVRDANFAFARGLGADVPIDYEKEDYVDAVMRETDGRGQLRPHVGAVYSLDDIALAHALLERPNNGVRGKIAIAVGPSAHLATAHV